MATTASAGTPAGPEPGFAALFDGTEASFKGWQFVGKGFFSLAGGALVAKPGDDLGLLFYAKRTFGDFVLRLEFRLAADTDNSGVFVRFRDPRLPVPRSDNPAISDAYDNPAWAAVTTGYEVQIDEMGRPDGKAEQTTGALYKVPVGPAPGQQVYRRGPRLQWGDWNAMEITVRGQTYTVRINGQGTTTATLNDGYRGRAPAADPAWGYIGLQVHMGNVSFRNIRCQDLAAAGPVPTAVTRAPQVKTAAGTRTPT
jgi:hypothetical protein